MRTTLLAYEATTHIPERVRVRRGRVVALWHQTPALETACHCTMHRQMHNTTQSWMQNDNNQEICLCTVTVECQITSQVKMTTLIRRNVSQQKCQSSTWFTIVPKTYLTLTLTLCPNPNHYSNPCPNPNNNADKLTWGRVECHSNSLKLSHLHFARSHSQSLAHPLSMALARTRSNSLTFSRTLSNSLPRCCQTTQLPLTSFTLFLK